MTNDIIRMSQLGGFNTYLLVGKKRQSNNSSFKKRNVEPETCNILLLLLLQPLRPEFYSRFYFDFYSRATIYDEKEKRFNLDANTFLQSPVTIFKT